MQRRHDAPVACSSPSGRTGAVGRVPPLAWFATSAVFHYLGPAFAVLLFARVAPLGVTWLRVASAALVLAAWRRPWRVARRLDAAARCNVAALGLVLGGMNACFYLAIARVPLGTVGAIEFLGPIALAVAGLRSRRNVVALALVAAGVSLLTRVHLGGAPLGLAFAFANAALFALYIVLGHRVANTAGASAIDRLAAAMLVALLAVTPVGLRPAWPSLRDPVSVAAGFGVGMASSVVPYVCDQLAMARLPRASFALLLALLPAIASLIGALVLHQVPGPRDAIGIALVAAGVALHRPTGT